MIKKTNDININYELYGNGSDTIVFLHGWGQNIAMMKPIANPLAKKHQILILDLPGFGSSEEPKTAITVYEYVDIINKLINELKLTNITLVGHSFGGKLALLYASKYKTKKLVVLASPFDVEIKKLSLKTRLFKTIKKLPGMSKISEAAKKYIGSTDYKNASPIMREILTKHVNTDITKDVRKIKCPTLIIWGTSDEMVNVKKAYELRDLIKDSAVIIYPYCTHYAYLEDLDKTNRILSSFTEE